MKKISVTGGAGFSGSCILENSLKQGQQIHFLDDLTSGGLESFLLLKDGPHFHLVLGSIII